VCLCQVVHFTSLSAGTVADDLFDFLCHLVDYDSTKRIHAFCSTSVVFIIEWQKM